MQWKLFNTHWNWRADKMHHMSYFHFNSVYMFWYITCLNIKMIQFLYQFFIILHIQRIRCVIWERIFRNWNRQMIKWGLLDFRLNMWARTIVNSEEFTSWMNRKIQLHKTVHQHFIVRLKYLLFNFIRLMQPNEFT